MESAIRRFGQRVNIECAGRSVMDDVFMSSRVVDGLKEAT